MDLKGWVDLFGNHSDDTSFVKAVAKAGVKKVPKLRKERSFEQFDLEGHGLALRLTDEAYLRDLDMDLGVAPLIFSGLIAYLDSSVSDHLYGGELPYGLAAGMTRRAVRKAMGRPKRSTDEDDPPILDAWLVDGLEVIATYSSSGLLRMLGLQLQAS